MQDLTEVGTKTNAPETGQRVSAIQRTISDHVTSEDPLNAEAQSFLLNYAGGENLFVDFKEDFSGTDREWLEITKDIVSFANTFGGYLVFGIVDGSYEKKGMNISHAVLLSDPSFIQAKVNRFIYPPVQTISCTRKQKLSTDLFYAFIHVPQSKNATHIVQKDGSFKDKDGKDKTSLKHGEIYVRLVGKRDVINPQSFEELLHRRMEQYKKEIFKRITQVVHAPAESKIVIFPNDAHENETAIKYRLSSDPSATPLVGVSPTAIPTNDEEELATIVAAFKKNNTHKPSPLFLYRLYSGRLNLKITDEYIAPLIEMCVISDTPCTYWIRQGNVKSVMEALLRTANNNRSRMFNALRFLALLDPIASVKNAKKLLAESDNFTYQKIRNAIKQRNPQQLFEDSYIKHKQKKIPNATPSNIFAEIESEATALADRLAKGNGQLPDKWRLDQYDIWLYGTKRQ